MGRRRANHNWLIQRRLIARSPQAATLRWPGCAILRRTILKVSRAPLQSTCETMSNQRSRLFTSWCLCPAFWYDGGRRRDEIEFAGWIARAFDSRRLPPAICTSAARARRCSTGCSRAGTAARSSFASKTPTPSDRPTRWWRASSSRCAGWASSGTKGPEVGGPHAPYFQSQRFERHRERSRSSCSPAGHAYQCYCSPELLKEKREDAEKAGGGWKYDRTCLRSVARRAAASRGVRRAAGHPFQGAGRQDVVHGSRARRDRVRPRADRGFRHPALERPADVSAVGGRRRHRHGASRT